MRTYFKFQVLSDNIKMVGADGQLMKSGQRDTNGNTKVGDTISLASKIHPIAVNLKSKVKWSRTKV